MDIEPVIIIVVIIMMIGILISMLISIEDLSAGLITWFLVVAVSLLIVIVMGERNK